MTRTPEKPLAPLPRDPQKESSAPQTVPPTDPAMEGKNYFGRVWENTKKFTRRAWDYITSPTSWITGAMFLAGAMGINYMTGSNLLGMADANTGIFVRNLVVSVALVGPALCGIMGCLGLDPLRDKKDAEAYIKAHPKQEPEKQPAQVRAPQQQFEEPNPNLKGMPPKPTHQPAPHQTRIQGMQ